MERGYVFLLALNLSHEACTRLGKGATVGLLIFRLGSGVQEPVFGKSNLWSGSLIVFYNLF